MPKKKEGYSKSTLFKKTLPYIKKEWKLVLITLFLNIGIALLTTITPLFTKEILDTYIPANNIEMILWLIGAYLLCTIIVVVMRYFGQYLQTLAGMHIERNLREDAIRKIDYLPVDYFSLEPDGKIVAKITSDSNGVRTFYMTMFSIINAIINIVIVYVGLIYLKPILGLIILAIVPLILIWITVYRRKVHKYYLDLRETGSRITGKLNELISGALIIQDFNQEDNMMNEYKELVNRYNYNDVKANTINIYFGWELLTILKRLAEIGILFFIGYEALGSAGITAGLITTFIGYLDRMINPINAIFNNLNELEDSLVAANRVYQFMDEANDTRILDGKEAPDEIKGDVEFKHIRFAYIEDNYVLKDLSLSVPAGKKIGIVGHTGSGKSSLMNLLLGYNDYQEGELLVDGVDIKIYNKASYRKNLGIVLQTPALFAGTIRSNVTMERDYPDEEVIKVIEEVGAGYMLAKSELGLDTPISFKGENLSLGEKQLLSFARILLRKPKILVLDEATANIDSETEIRIKHAMDVVAKGRTTFIIAHRLSTIKDADEIVVLDHGIIVGKGSHTHLYDTCPIYKDMYDSQFEKNKVKGQ
ncbi:MAG: ABC transporter ATP-binding protein/permease [Roseburia sp.]|nr:ABC transporter ATP-binding protein/permease [Anaeroplasma bactoclasticum]MCM1196151.1 ABC transporter ATP-binding protein/permease [Roseburia sp.]MCM1557641.1 ABC transporter ATP-binding protein/permease [Anaeroplasma bactoclasticum]